MCGYGEHDIAVVELRPDGVVRDGQVSQISREGSRGIWVPGSDAEIAEIMARETGAVAEDILEGDILRMAVLG